MKFVVKLESEDLVDFNVFHLTSNEVSKKTYNKQRIIASLIVLGVGAITTYLTKSNQLLVMLVTASLAVFTFLNYPNTIKKSIKKKVKAEVKKGTFDNTLIDVETVISKSGITQGVGENKMELKWSEVARVFNFSDTSYIYSSSYAIIVPHRCLDEKQLKDFVEIILENVDNDNVLDVTMKK